MKLVVAVKQFHTVWCQWQTSIMRNSIPLYIRLLKLELFSSPREDSHREKTWHTCKVCISKVSRGPLAFSVSVFSGLLRSLLIWPLNCKMYTDYRQNYNDTGKKNQDNRPPTISALKSSPFCLGTGGVTVSRTFCRVSSWECNSEEASCESWHAVKYRS